MSIKICRNISWLLIVYSALDKIEKKIFKEKKTRHIEHKWLRGNESVFIRLDNLIDRHETIKFFYYLLLSFCVNVLSLIIFKLFLI